MDADFEGLTRRSVRSLHDRKPNMEVLSSKTELRTTPKRPITTVDQQMLYTHSRSSTAQNDRSETDVASIANETATDSPHDIARGTTDQCRTDSPRRIRAANAKEEIRALKEPVPVPLALLSLLPLISPRLASASHDHINISQNIAQPYTSTVLESTLVSYSIFTSPSKC
jgi:hypothetical protein